MKKGRRHAEPPSTVPTYPNTCSVLSLPWEGTSVPAHYGTLPQAHFGGPSPAVPQRILFQVEGWVQVKHQYREGDQRQGLFSFPAHPRDVPQPALEGKVSSQYEQGQPGSPVALPGINLSPFVLSQGQVKEERVDINTLALTGTHVHIQPSTTCSMS